VKLTELVVRKPVSAFILIVGIVVFGIMSVSSMDQESTPEMETPMMIVMTNYSNVGPEDVDELVTSVVEGAVGSLSGLKSISSTSSEGSSRVMLEYEYGTDMDTAYIDLKERLDRVNLPDDAGTPTVMQMSSNSSASIRLSIRSDEVDNLLQMVNDEISPEFEKLSSVAEVSVRGGQEDYISVELLEDKLQQYGITMGTVVNSVSNADFSQPSGEIDYGSQTLSLTSSVSYKTVSDLENLPISLGNGNIIRLADVANVYEAKTESNSVSRYNGEETISVNITKRQSATAVSVSNQVRAVVEELGVSQPELSIEVMSDESETIQESIQSVAETLILAVIISMVVLFIFLGDYKASLIVGSSMPVSLLVAFICMSLMGFTLNIITMSAMVLGVGMMVDNSIVVLDSCFKSQSREKTFVESAIQGTKFVLLSIVGGTLTTVVVFLPLTTITGMVGQLFESLGYTIAFALLASLLSAMTLVPLFYTRYQPREKRNAPAALLLKRVERAYGKLLKKLLNKKKTVFSISVALVAAALFMASNLNMELMSSTDEGSINISIETRPGTQLEKTDALVLQIEEMVAAHPDVESYTANAGGGASRMGGSSNSVSATLRDNRDMSTAEIVEQWRIETKDILDCDITISSQSSMTGGMSSDDVEINLKGNDLDTLREFSEEIVAVFKQHPDMITVTTSLEDGSPQAEIVVDSMKAAAYGLTPSEVASNVNTALSGRDAATITRDGKDYTVTVEYPADKYTNLNDVKNMILVTSSGTSVPLVDVASIEFSNAPQSINKEDSQYLVTITGTPKTSAKFTAQSELTAQVNQMQFPSGVSLTESSMRRMMNEEFGSLYQAIAIAVLLVFMVMTIQFESIKHSLMVMVCIPISIIGSVALLNLTGVTLSMTSLLGFLILVGTVVNNGILFVDTTNEYRKSMDLHTALVHTGRTRLRPILMTTLTTILSMVPMAMGLGTGSEMMQGLGIVVIGGLTAGTILTLLFLPTFYLIIDGNPEKKKQREEKRRIRHEKQHQKEEEKDRLRRERYAQKIQNELNKKRGR